MLRLPLAILLAATACGGARAPTAPPAPTPPAGPRRIDGLSTGDYESHLVLGAGGDEAFYLKNTPDFAHWTIVTARRRGGGWGRPEVAPFSGRWSDADPFLTADGRRLFFISNRPPSAGLDLWMVDRAGAGWGEPQRLPEPINSPGNEWFPNLAADGTLYFGSDRAGGHGRTDLYRARPAGAGWAAPENLGPAVNSALDEFEPCIAPDQSWLIFMAVRRDGLGGFDLYLSRAGADGWTAPRNLGAPINSAGNELGPALSPDRRRLLFTSTRGFGLDEWRDRLDYAQLERALRAPGNGLGDLYETELAPLL